MNDINHAENTVHNNNIMFNRKQSDLTIGYYNIRGKAQVPRLLLEYLEI